MNKVYLMWVKDENEDAFIAAPNYNKARKIFAEHIGIKKYVTDKINGKVLLNENPISSVDYLTTYNKQGIIKDFNQKFFKGDKDKLTSLEKKIKDYIDRRIDRRIEKQIDEYFDRQIPKFKEEN